MFSLRLVAVLGATLCALLSGVFAASPAEAAQGRIIIVDAPGAGNASGQGTGCFGCGLSINQFGAITSSYLDANNVFHGFIRDGNGRYSSFEAPGADTTPQSFNGTISQSINDLGETAGYYADATGSAHGFVRSIWGTYESFDAPGAANGTIPVFIGLDGSVVGYSLDANFLFHAFLRKPDGSFAVFVGPQSCTGGTPVGCYGSEATFVGLFGITVGNFEDNSANLVAHGMIRTPNGRITVFDAPGAGTGLYQGTGCPGCNMGVNILGAIAGSYTDANNVFHGFVRYGDGTFVTFDANGAGTESYQGTGCFSDCPMALNDLGTVAGSYWDSNYVQHGFVRSPDGHFATIDPPTSVATQPETINDAGTVAGYYIDSNNVMHGFIRQAK